MHCSCLTRLAHNPSFNDSFIILFLLTTYILAIIAFKENMSW